MKKISLWTTLVHDDDSSVKKEEGDYITFFAFSIYFVVSFITYQADCVRFIAFSFDCREIIDEIKIVQFTLINYIYIYCIFKHHFFFSKPVDKIKIGYHLYYTSCFVDYIICKDNCFLYTFCWIFLTFL